MSNDVAAMARRHGLSEDAGQALYDALVAGGGRQAQFSHPDLGGMGQWSGGMTQIGDMFNDALKARIGAFCRDMSDAAATARRQVQAEARPDAPPARSASGRWWPAPLGVPAARGTQNGMGYACFPDKRRLALKRDGIVTLYDTGPHALTGFSQSQPGSGGDLAFASQQGPVTLDDFRVVEG